MGRKQGLEGNLTSVFLSYSWDSDEHKRWVAALGSKLKAHEVAVKLDQTDLRPGADLTRYMEASVRESDYVLLICTPAFPARADDRVGGVGYEQAVVTGEIFSGTAHPEKFIPVLRGDPATSVPSFLQSRLWVDFRDDEVFDQAFAELLSTIGPEGNDRLTELRPILDTKILSDHEDLLVYEKAFDFARSKTGLAKTRAVAEEFAEECREFWSLAAFQNFAEIFTFVWSTMKLSRSDAEEFARTWMDRDDWGEFALYRNAFEFAKSQDGMGMRLSDARRWIYDFDEARGLGDFERFECAFRIARNGGQSRSDAEDFAYDKLDD